MIQSTYTVFGKWGEGATLGPCAPPILIKPLSFQGGGGVHSPGPNFQDLHGPTGVLKWPPDPFPHFCDPSNTIPGDRLGFTLYFFINKQNKI